VCWVCHEDISSILGAYVHSAVGFGSCDCCCRATDAVSVVQRGSLWEASLDRNKTAMSSPKRRHCKQSSCLTPVPQSPNARSRQLTLPTRHSALGAPSFSTPCTVPSQTSSPTTRLLLCVLTVWQVWFCGDIPHASSVCGLTGLAGEASWASVVCKHSPHWCRVCVHLQPSLAKTSNATRGVHVF